MFCETNKILLVRRLAVFHLIHDLLDDEESKSVIPRAVEVGHGYGCILECGAAISKFNRDHSVCETYFNVDRSISIGAIGMENDVGCCFLHGQLDLGDLFILDSSTEMRAERVFQPDPEL